MASVSNPDGDPSGMITVGTIDLSKRIRNILATYNLMSRHLREEWMRVSS